jgi:hypothetical protein
VLGGDSEHGEAGEVGGGGEQGEVGGASPHGALDRQLGYATASPDICH